jgi:ubiquinol-cytochrome c reductase cytochrome c1 subunit
MNELIWKTCAITLAAGLFLSGIVGIALAAGPAAHPQAQEWSFEGPFGAYDRASAQRGFHVYKEVCASCHGLKYVAFRTLGDLGFSEAEVKVIAAAYMITDGPDEFGEMYERLGLPSDYFPSPFANDNAARAAMGGALPPDLSLITKARADGANYTFALMLGYVEPPEDFDLSSGLSYNPYFPNSEIAMPPPLFEGQLDYSDGTEATVEQMSKDVVMFLAWAAEPKLEARLKLGFKFFAVMIVLTILLYFSNRKVWSGLKGKDD